MASTKESNTSKTAHVMNLLSRTRGGAAPTAEPVEGAPAQPAAPAETAPQIAPILSSMEADAAVSTQIKDALEDALSSALEEDIPPAASAPEVPAPMPEPEQKSEPALSTVQPAGAEEPPAPPVQWPELESEDVEPEAPASSPFQEPEAAVSIPPLEDAPVQQAPPSQPEPVPPATAVPEDPEPLAQTASPSPETAAPAALLEDSPQEREITYVNVMEVLVEERAGKYMEMFGMCQCDRCKSDVKALALNSLPSKYVVMGRGEFVPRITVYEGRFSAAIIAQLLRSCKIVMDSPRHDQQEL